MAVLYICTGKYSTFWDEFYTSAETYFLPECDKQYFVFTDDQHLLHQNEKVHVSIQKQLEWPYSTLMRFHIFSQAIEKLKKFDYVFFFNANAVFLKTIGEQELLPSDGIELVGLVHPGYFQAKKRSLPFEKRRKSAAFIPPANRHVYYQGCLNGGTAGAFTELIQNLKQAVQTDLDKGIIAIWHDESHLNCYFSKRVVKALNPSYAYPEGWALPFDAKIVMRDKAKAGGHNLFRKTVPRQTTSNLWIFRIKERIKQMLLRIEMRYS